MVGNNNSEEQALRMEKTRSEKDYKLIMGDNVWN